MKKSKPKRATRKRFPRISEPGAAPGTLTTLPEEPLPDIQVIAYSQSNFEEKQLKSIDEIAQIRERNSVTWINVEGLGDAEVIKQLGEIFGLHQLALEDVINAHQRPKVEDYGEVLFVVARMTSNSGARVAENTEPEEDPGNWEFEQIGMFLGDNFLLTFQEGRPGDCLDGVRNRLRRSNGKIRQRGADYLLYAILDSVIDHYFPLVESYGERLDELDEKLLNNGDKNSMKSIHTFRSELTEIRRTMRSHRESVSQLARDSLELISDETRLFLRDCYDHTLQLFEAIETYRETCSDLRDFHLSNVGMRTNDVMKTLTIIATIFIPLSFVTGLYGMNFDYIPELKWKFGYLYVWILIGLIAGNLLFWFQRRGWFADHADS